MNKYSRLFAANRTNVRFRYLFSVCFYSLVACSPGAAPSLAKGSRSTALAGSEEERVARGGRTVIDGVEVDQWREGVTQLSAAAVDEAVGIVEPEPQSQVAYSLETGIGQVVDDRTVISDWAIVRRNRVFLSVEQRVARLNDLRSTIAEVQQPNQPGRSLDEVRHDVDESVDTEIERVRRSAVDPPPPVIPDHDVAELESREESEAIVDVCGPLLTPIHLPREMLKLDLLGRADEMADRSRTLRARREEAARIATAHLDEVVARYGGSVLDRSKVEACVVAVLPSRSAVLGLADSPDVRSVLLADRETKAFKEALFHGDEIRMGLQLQQFWDASMFGDVASTRPGGFSELTAGIVDEGFQDRHVAFLDTTSPTSTSRINGRWNCTGNFFGCGGSSCTQYATDLPWHDGFEPGDSVDHGTTVASILVGDFMDGQEASTTLVPVSSRGDFSGYAPEAGVTFLQGNGFCADRAAALNRAATLNVDLVSMSVCAGQTVTGCSPNAKIACSHQCRCDGDDSDLNDEVNSIFKDGILTVKAAGNEDADSTCCPCTVTSPGDAEGALAVGGHGGASTNASTPFRSVSNLISSSRGLRELRKNGGAREGTVVGISAPRPRGMTAACEQSSCPESSIHLYEDGSDPEQGTSFATPTVAAAGLLIKENSILNGSPVTWLDQAEIMKLHLFANGDRFSAAGLKTAGFDKDYGAGRLRARMFNADGMDSPWRVSSGWTTLSDGEVFVRIASSDGSASPIPTGVDSLKAIAWWYEPRTENSDSTPAAHISLELLRYDSTCTTLLGSSADASFDTRKMLFKSTNVGGFCYRMRLVGDDVSTNPEAGNANTRRVNWMFIWEDDDGDATSGPTRCTASGVPADCVESL